MQNKNKLLNSKPKLLKIYKRKRSQPLYHSKENSMVYNYKWQFFSFNERLKSYSDLNGKVFFLIPYNSEKKTNYQTLNGNKM